MRSRETMGGLLAVALLGCNEAPVPTTDSATGTGSSSGAPAGGTSTGPLASSSGPSEDETSTGSDPPDPPPPDIGTGGVPDPMEHRFTDVSVAAGLGDLDPGQLLIPPFCVLDSIVGPAEVTGDYCLPERFLGAAAVGDFDGDQWPDVYLTRMDGPDWLLRNQGDGTFVDVAAAAGLTQAHVSGGAAWIDVEGDGDLDLMLTVIGDARSYLYVNDGAGHFSEEGVERGFALDYGMVHVGTSIGVGDYDLDGYLDVYVGDWHSSVALGPGPDYNRLLHNLGPVAPGVFEDVTQAMGMGMQAVSAEVGSPPGAWGFSPAFVDLDGDLWPELALASDYGASRLWHNDSGTFVDVTAAAGVGSDENGMGSTFGDYDGDGDLDWFITAITSPDLDDPGNRLFRNEGALSFTDVTDQFGVREAGWGWGTAFFDGDLDGDLDLVTTAGYPGSVFGDDPVRLWVNTGPAGPWPDLAVERGLDFRRQGRGLVTFDFDRDGDLDVLVHSNTEPPALFRNDVQTGSWLEVRAKGPGGNTQAIGAQVRVWVTPEGTPLVRQIGVASHYMGQAEAAAYFGLGEGEAPLHRVEITWPTTGELVVRHDVPRNQRLLLHP